MENKTKKTKTQDIRFFIVVYDEPTQEQLIQCGCIEYSYIKHDSDLTDDGEPKKAHYHLYIKLRARKTINAIAKIFNINEKQAQFFVQFVADEVKSIRYLIHADDAEKYQYNIKDIISNMNLDSYFNLELTDLEFVKNVINDIANNIITKYKDIVYYAISVNKLELVMKRAYFFKMLF